MLHGAELPRDALLREQARHHFLVRARLPLDVQRGSGEAALQREHAAKRGSPHRLHDGKPQPRRCSESSRQVSGGLVAHPGRGPRIGPADELPDAEARAPPRAHHPGGLQRGGYRRGLLLRLGHDARRRGAARPAVGRLRRERSRHPHDAQTAPRNGWATRFRRSRGNARGAGGPGCPAHAAGRAGGREKSSQHGPARGDGAAGLRGQSRRRAHGLPRRPARRGAG